MKVMKAIKKLKFWSRKKRKRKQASPSQAHQCSCEYSSPVSAIEPTAPPLPLWFDEFQSLCAPETSTIPWNTQLLHGQQEETIVETSPLSHVSDPCIYQSYQQYMVPNPTCGVPNIVDAAATKRSLGIFGGVIELSLNVVHCFFPCFRN